MSDRIVIVGGGLAAARVVRAYREAGGSAPVTMLSADTRLPYHRPPLSKGFLRGEIETEAVFVEPAGAYAELDIDVRLGTEVTAVDTHAKQVTLADGAAVEYGRLVLASGSLPRSLDVPGGQLAGIHGYRTLDDARAVRAAAADATHALIVGAGFIGMETAASLRFLGLEVTLIEPGERLFAALQNPELSRSLEQLYGDRGIDVVLGDAVEAFHGGSGRLERATTRAGRTVDAQLAIVGIGVQPSTRYLDEASIGMERGAVLVDERFETTVPGVYAIGDLAYFHDPVVRTSTPHPTLDKRKPPRRTPRPHPRGRNRPLRPGRLLLHRARRHQDRAPRRPRRRPRPNHQPRHAGRGTDQLLPRRRPPRRRPHRRPTTRNPGATRTTPSRPRPARAPGHSHRPRCTHRLGIHGRPPHPGLRRKPAPPTRCSGPAGRSPGRRIR